MRAQLAFSTLGCGELELSEALALAASRQVDAIELRTLGGSNDILDYFRARFTTPEALGAVVQASGIAVASVDTSIEAISAGVADRQELMDLAPWVAAADAPRIRLFDGGETGSDAEIDSAGELVAWWHDYCAAEGWQFDLAIETHDALAQPEALQRFIDRVPMGRILWDTHHTWKEGGEMPHRTWQRLRGRTDHLHIKDSRAERDVFTYVPPGQGSFPFNDLMFGLDADRFGGTVSLEWERHWFPELPPITEALDGFERVFGPSALAVSSESEKERHA